MTQADSAPLRADPSLFGCNASAKPQGTVVFMRHFPKSWAEPASLGDLPLRMRNILSRFGQLIGTPCVRACPGGTDVVAVGCFEDDAAARSAAQTLHGVDMRPKAEQVTSPPSPKDKFWIQVGPTLESTCSVDVDGLIAMLSSDRSTSSTFLPEVDTEALSSHILVRGFPPSWREPQLRCIFVIYGGVSSVQFVRDAEFGRAARIELKDMSALSRAASQLNNTSVGDGEVIEECVIFCSHIVGARDGRETLAYKDSESSHTDDAVRLANGTLDQTREQLDSAAEAHTTNFEHSREPCGGGAQGFDVESEDCPPTELLEQDALARAESAKQRLLAEHKRLQALGKVALDEGAKQVAANGSINDVDSSRRCRHRHHQHLRSRSRSRRRDHRSRGRFRRRRRARRKDSRSTSSTSRHRRCRRESRRSTAVDLGHSERASQVCVNEYEGKRHGDAKAPHIGTRCDDSEQVKRDAVVDAAIGGEGSDTEGSAELGVSQDRRYEKMEDVVGGQGDDLTEPSASDSDYDPFAGDVAAPQAVRCRNPLRPHQPESVPPSDQISSDGFDSKTNTRTLTTFEEDTGDDEVTFTNLVEMLRAIGSQTPEVSESAGVAPPIETAHPGSWTPQVCPSMFFSNAQQVPRVEITGEVEAAANGGQEVPIAATAATAQAQSGATICADEQQPQRATPAKEYWYNPRTQRYEPKAKPQLQPVASTALPRVGFSRDVAPTWRAPSRSESMPPETLLRDPRMMARALATQSRQEGYKRILDDCSMEARADAARGVCTYPQALAVRLALRFESRPEDILSSMAQAGLPAAKDQRSTAKAIMRLCHPDKCRHPDAKRAMQILSPLLT